MKSILIILKEYTIPLIILLVFPLLDFLMSIESKFYGQVTVDTIIVDVSQKKSVETINELDNYENEITILKDRIDLRISNEFKKGEDYFKSGNLNEAEKIWSKLIEKDVQKALLINNIGVISSKRGELNKADSLFRLAIEIDSLYDNAWYNLARTASRMENEENAKKYYHKAININPQISKALFNLALLYVNSKEYTTALNYITLASDRGFSKDRVAFTKGIIFGKEGDTINALLEFDQSLKYNPGSIRTRYQKVLLLLGQQREVEAQLLLNQISKIDSTFYKADLAFASFKLKEKKYLEASKVLMKLINKHPQNISVLYEQAKLLGIQGRDKDALEIYERIKKLDHDNPRVYYNMAINLMDVGNVIEGEKAYLKALSLDPLHWQSSYNLGVYYLKNGNFKKAEKYLINCMTSNDNHIQSRYNLALTYLKMKERNKAERTFNEVLAIDNKHENTIYNIALIKLSRKLLDEADSLFNKVLEINPNHTKSIFNIALIYKRKKNDRKALEFFNKVIDVENGYAKASYNIALIYIENGDVNNAHKALNIAIKDDPNYLKAYFKKVDLFTSTNEVLKAEEILLKVKNKSHINKNDLIKIAEKYAKVDKYKESILILQSLLNQNLTNYNIYEKLIENYFAIYDYKNALKFLEMIPIENRKRSILKLSGKIYKEVGNEKDAIENYKKYLLQKPDDVNIRRYLADQLKSSKNYKEAAKEYQRLVNIDKRNYSYAINAGLMYMKLNQLELSMSIYKKAQTLDKTKKTPQYYIALLYYKQGLIDSALISWNEFISKYPDDGRGYYQLGKIYLDKNDIVKASLLFRKAVDLKENRARYYLAETLYVEKQYSEAKFELNKYLDINKKSKKGIILLKKINKKI